MQVRDFYGIELAGKAASNPGWDDAVCGVLGALSLVGRRRAQLDRLVVDRVLARYLRLMGFRADAKPSDGGGDGGDEEVCEGVPGSTCCPRGSADLQGTPGN